MSLFQKIFSILFILPLFISCSATLHISQQAKDHIIALQGDGHSYILETHNKNQDKLVVEYNYKEHISSLIKGIKQSNRDSILIYVHGGMKSIGESVEEAEEQSKIIMNTTGQYPIYINWESSMMDAYIEHLFFIRQGKYSPLMGPISSIFYLLVDFGRVIVRAPITWGHQGFNLVTSTIVLPAPDDTLDEHLSHTFYPDETKIYLGESQREFGDDLGNYMSHFQPGICKIVTTPLLDAFGHSAWSNLLRRTQKLFKTPEEFNLYDINKTDVSYKNPTGGISIFMDSLTNILKNNDYHVTLMGHSMGCIIINEIIQHYGDIHLDNIVMMAPACTIQDFEHKIIPYLQKPENKSTQLYILTIHPESEVRESAFYDIIPRGSLLDWIDDFASKPMEFTEVTLGKWDNIIRASHIIPYDIRDQITIKGFGYRIDGDPQNHADFNDVTRQFWRSDFWEIPRK